jgi:uncharacterized protein YecT (DUF1311 family)
VVANRCMLALWIVGVAAFARADVAPAADCKTATTPVHQLVCSDDRLARLDREIDRVFRLVESETRSSRDGNSTITYYGPTGIESGPPGDEGPLDRQAIRVEQQQWLVQRTTDCAVHHGDGKDGHAARCMEDLDALRLHALRNDTGEAGPALDDLTGALTLEKTVSVVPVGGYSPLDESGRFLLKHDIIQGKLKLALLNRVTGAATPIDADLDAKDGLHLLLADDSGALIEHRMELLQVDASGRVTSRYPLAGQAVAAAIYGKDLLVIEDNPFLRDDAGYRGRFATQHPPNLRIESFTLGASRDNSVRTIPPGPLARLWRGHLVLLAADGHVSIYSNRHDLLSETALPFAPDDQNWIRASAAVVLGDLLLIPVRDKGACVFDLAHLRVQPCIATNAMVLKKSGDLLFALDGTDLAIFDITTGRGVTRFHIAANDLDVDGNRLTMYWGEDASLATTWRMDLDHIRSHETTVQTLLAADARARDALTRRGTVDAALNAMDLLETSALSDPRLDPRLQPVALDYASWLATTLGRRAQGIAILKQLHAADAGNAVIRHRLGAALLRDFLVDGDAKNLERARSLIDPAGFPSADLSKWQSTRARDIARPLGADLSGDVYFSGSTIFVVKAEERQLAEFHTFDRNTLRPRATLDLNSLDIQNITGMTFHGSLATLWFSGGTKPTALTLDTQTGKRVYHRLSFKSGFVAQTEQGDLSCNETEKTDQSLTWECAVLDPATFRTVRRFLIHKPPILVQGIRDFMPDAAIPDTFAGRILLDARHYPGTVVAASNHWVAMTRYTTEPFDSTLAGGISLGRLVADSGLIYRDAGSAEAPLRAATRPLTNALIVDRRGKLLEMDDDGVSELDLATNANTSLTDLQEDRYSNPCVIGGNLLFCLDGSNLIAYDLQSRSLAAILPGIVPDREPRPGFCRDLCVESSNDFRKLQVDGDHLFVVVEDEGRSRVINLAAFAPHAALGARLFKTADRLLAR